MKTYQQYRPKAKSFQAEELYIAAFSQWCQKNSWLWQTYIENLVVFGPGWNLTNNFIEQHDTLVADLTCSHCQMPWPGKMSSC
jgi:hypothetical protein